MFHIFVADLKMIKTCQSIETYLIIQYCTYMYHYLNSEQLVTYMSFLNLFASVCNCFVETFCRYPLVTRATTEEVKA
jgi:hypothetical protein